MSRHAPPLRPGHMDVFVDGQNLYKSAKSAFGHHVPNFDIMSLAHGLAENQNCRLGNVNFYTGMPGIHEDPKWHHFWARKLADMGRMGVHIFTSPLRYQVQTERMFDGSERTFKTAREKGVDVRIAIDMVKHALLNTGDTMMVVSRDNDLAEAVKEARLIAADRRRRLEVWSAYPVSRECDHRGIRDTRWMPMPAEFYNAHLDGRNYFVPENEVFNRQEQIGLSHPNAAASQHQKTHGQREDDARRPDLSENPIIERAQRAAHFVHQNDHAADRDFRTPSENEKQDIQRHRLSP